MSPPLFNKPAFLVGADGSLCIRRVSCEAGLCAQSGRSRVELAAEQRNLSEPGQQVCFYDLLYPGATLPGARRSLVRPAGNRGLEGRAPLPRQALPVPPLGPVGHWAPAVQAAVAIHPGVWGVELAVPLASLDHALPEGFWGVNFSRFTPANAAASRWVGARRVDFNPAVPGSSF